MKKLIEIKLFELLPESIKHDEQVTAAAKALDNELVAITEAIKKLALLKTIDSQSEEIVDLLAWQRHVDFYEPDMPLETKREVVKASKVVHTRKGTPSAVESLLNAVFEGSTVTEWFEYGGQPFMFTVSIVDRVSDPQPLDNVIAAINAAKNTRSRLEKIKIKRQNIMPLYFGTVTKETKNTLLKIKFLPDTVTADLSNAIGIASRVSNNIKIFQEVQ